MRSGWNPTRRNRNIETKKQGHGRNNELVIPASWPEDSVFWERLSSPIAISRMVKSQELTFLVEPTRQGWIHACTVEDICQVLEQIESSHLIEIELIILRQPTRKQSILKPVWGRLAYYAVTGQYSGTAIILEAMNPADRWQWPVSLTPDDEKELDRLREDGHRVTMDNRYHKIERTLASIRSTQLYRTLLHEVGHYVDWLTHLVNPSSASIDEAEEERIRTVWDAKPIQEREAFAHRYAAETRAELVNKGIIPFARILDQGRMQSDGLDPMWFTES